MGYGTSNNNGNVLSQTITMPKQPSGTLTLTQAYGYDGVNRLASAGETVTAGGSGGGAWSFTHGYDQFGNMWVSNASGLTAHSATPRGSDQFGATTNRLTKAFDGSTLSNPYDEAGNLINHPYVGAMQYDAENRQKQFTSGSTTATYHYDGDGRRVKRVLGGQTTVYVYDAFGMLAAEYSTATPTETGGRRYRTTDHLGSTRLVTDDTGAVKTRHDYVPFGEELPASSSAGNRNLVFGFGASPSERHKFTGKERDAESGLDYFGARYVASAQGRFTSPDAPFGDQTPADPQSWNLYAYARNSPTSLIDPDGRAVQLGAAALAAANGFVVDVGFQVFREGKSLRDVHYRRSVAVSVGAGLGVATFGALAPGAATVLTLSGETTLAAGSATALKTGAAVTGGVVGGALEKVIETGDPERALGDTPVEPVVNGLSGPFGEGLEQAGRQLVKQTTASKALDNLQGQLERARTTNRSGVIASRVERRVADVRAQQTTADVAASAAAQAAQQRLQRCKEDGASCQ